MAEVKFKRGSFSEYTNATKDQDTLYFIQDRPSLFLGSSAIVGVYSATVSSGTAQIGGNNVTTNNVTIYAYSGANGAQAAYSFSTVNPNIVSALTSYVQSQLGNYVAKSGDTMNGNLTMSSASVVFEGGDGKPGGTTGSVAVHCAGSGSVTGGGITGTAAFSAESAFNYSILALESNAGADNKSISIKNVSWPYENLDAANKLYVDAQVASVVAGEISNIKYIKEFKSNGFRLEGATTGEIVELDIINGNYIGVSSATVTTPSTSGSIMVSAITAKVDTVTGSGIGLADAYDVKRYISGVSASIIAQSDAMVYKGPVSAELSAGTYNKGWTYRVSSPFSGYGHQLEAGDMIIVNTDITASTKPTSTQVDIIQANIDGAVTTTGLTSAGGTVTLSNGTHSVRSLDNPEKECILWYNSGIGVHWDAAPQNTDTKYTILHSGGALNTVELSGSDGSTSAITIDNVASANSASEANHVVNSFKYTQDSSGRTGNNNVTYNGSASAEIKSTSALTSGHTASTYNYLVTEAAVVNYVASASPKPQWETIA